MKTAKKAALALCLALACAVFLMTACGQETQPRPLPPPAEPISFSRLLSAAFPVETRDFRETEGFPFPFEDPWLTLERDGQQTPALTLDQALYDYDAMWVLLEDNYPFFAAIQKERGIHWQALRDQTRNDILEKGAGFVTLAEFTEITGACLEQFQMVGHLYAMGGGMIKTLSQWAMSGIPFEGLAALTRAPKAQAYAEWHMLHASGSGGSGGRQSGPPGGVAFDVLEGMPYLKISTFGGWDRQTYDAVSDFQGEYLDAENLILDIRGNGGGSTGPWQTLILPRLFGSPVLTDTVLGMKNGSLNQFFFPMLADLPDLDQALIQERFPAADPACFAGLEKVYTAQTGARSAEWTEAAFSGKLWLLIDRQVYSASEALAAFCKRTGLATLVGEQTSGNGAGAQPYAMALPYSGLCVYYDPYFGFNSDGTCNGIAGTKPDIQAPEDALRTCLERIAGEN